jgi:nitroimidazol reductase NimA-like FMN-containing flavoprotein (pyridoxamine 5'-phosphate oxidase superfamily)
MNFDPSQTHIRRQVRAVKDDAWIQEFLEHAAYGFLALIADGLPYAHPSLYAYDSASKAIFLHSANAGRTFENVQTNPQVCFTVAEMGRLLPAPQACSFSLEYASVIVFGLMQTLTDPQDMLHGLGLLMTKYAPHLLPGIDYRPTESSDLHGVAVYRLDIQGWSAKRKQAPLDSSAAYPYR